MPEYIRSKTAGGTYFFTVNSHLRQPILTAPIVRQALRAGIQRARQTLPFVIQAWALLPDHLHTIWTLPPDDHNYSARWAIIKRQVSRDCGKQSHDSDRISDSRQKRRESVLWQKRFWEHQIRDELDFERHMDYLHWNPVKHGYVGKVADWPFSSFHRYVAQGVYPPDWCEVKMDKVDAGKFGE
jgi:putative transposase